MSSESLKSPKNESFRVLAKSYPLRYMFFLSHHESVNGLLIFYKNNMFGKNLFFKLLSKILKANQNAGFFKLEYLKKIS